ncbi:E3 ubiquitin-protein ligase RSL1-like [Euphorbia lathyris]|uniref:E3 ubiquitin-protein ligase RSL1-like n=1 Tax=Euphorbia lathyris TaxID=212925 RepID=UPI003313CFBB
MAKRTFSDLDFVDDAYFSALLDEENEQQEQPNNGAEFQVSDAKYAYGLQFQEALMGSVIISQLNKTSISSSILVLEPPLIPTLKSIEVLESGESSKAFCEICAERKEKDEMFAIERCIHSICSDCISKHVAVRIQGGSRIVTCPGLGCEAVLELDSCRPTLPEGVIDLWEKVLCEEMISAAHRFYCPFKDCSAMLVDDNEGGEVIRESECPLCHRLFCAQCHVPWHSGVNCEAFQGLNEDERGKEDLMVMQLANAHKWSRCPQCKFYVERTEGCPHITCRCKFQFCYGCGSEWTSNHGGCERT